MFVNCVNNLNGIKNDILNNVENKDDIINRLDMIIKKLHDRAILANKHSLKVQALNKQKPKVKRTRAAKPPELCKTTDITAYRQAYYLKNREKMKQNANIRHQKNKTKNPETP